MLSLASYAPSGYVTRRILWSDIVCFHAAPANTFLFSEIVNYPTTRKLRPDYILLQDILYRFLAGIHIPGSVNYSLPLYYDTGCILQG